VFVTKPFIHEGFNKRDREMVKFWMLYQPLTQVDRLPGKENGKVALVGMVAPSRPSLNNLTTAGRVRAAALPARAAGTSSAQNWFSRTAKRTI
ncbi:MAG: hypothetical protein WCH99_21995, partial [Verrucomicrobiota bacterium]